MSYLAMLSLSSILSLLSIGQPGHSSCTDNTVAVPTPMPSRPQIAALPASTDLSGISGLADNDVWAVGGWGVQSRKSPLVEHWNGSAWSSFSSPTLASVSSTLVAITEGAPDDIWAAGTFNRTTTHGLLLAHWDGSSWSEYTRDGGLATVAISMAPGVSNNVWAVGGFFRPSRLGATTVGSVHWNGHSWRVVPVPTNRAYGYLYGVVTFPNGDAIAVGYESNIIDDGDHSLIEREVGGSWTETNIDQRTDTYSAIAATSENDIWIAGSTSVYDKPFVERWNGASWSAQRLPYTGRVLVSSITEVSPTDVWVAGYPSYLAHFDGSKWTANIYVHSGDDLTSLGGIYASPAGALTAGSVWETYNAPSTIFATFAHC